MDAVILCKGTLQVEHPDAVLLDYIDVVVHVFHEKTREYYLLERLWGDAKKIEIADTRPA